MDLIRLFRDGFPLTTQRLEFLQQTYTKAFEQLFSLYGLRENEIGVLDNGVRPTDGSTGLTITDGIVIYNGEIMEFRGHVTTDSNFAIAEEIVEVPYNIDADNDGNLDPKASDVVRYMTTVGSGADNLTPIQVDFGLNRLPTIQQIMPQIGEVKMWKGTADNVPAGWQIMDDMNDRFPIGTRVGGSYDVNQNGGENRVTLTESQMPPHRHTGNTNFTGSHTHTYTYEDPRGTGGAGSENGNSRFETRQTGSGGAHSHSLNINNTGGGQSHENRPQFKALYFIEFVGF